jgi:multidrug resistance efflux pump
VLVELDADAHRLRLEEERTRLTALVAQPALLRDEISAEKAARREDQQAGRIALDQARARYREAEAAAQLSRQEAARMERLLARAYVAELDALRTKAEARKQREAADAWRLEISRLEWDLQLRLSGRQAHMQRLTRGVTQLEGQIATTRAVIEQLEHEIEQRYIRAPVTGRLGEVAVLQVGAIVRPDAAPPIPLQHGMPGTVELEVDRVSPAMLVLRTAGLLLTVPGTLRTLQGGRGAGR